MHDVTTIIVMSHSDESYSTVRRVNDVTTEIVVDRHFVSMECTSPEGVFFGLYKIISHSESEIHPLP